MEYGNRNFIEELQRAKKLELRRSPKFSGPEATARASLKVLSNLEFAHPELGGEPKRRRELIKSSPANRRALIKIGKAYTRAILG